MADVDSSQRHRSWLGAALVPPAAFAVHQLRYALAFGSDSGHELAAQGHGYLSSLTPIVVAAVALAFGAFLTRLARAWSTGQGEPAGHGRLARLWLVAAAGLLALYAGQELLEGALAAGHAPGLAGVFGDGGAWAVPAALAVGGLLALVVRGARAVVALVARARRRRERHPLTEPRLRRPALVVLRAPAPLAGSAAGRAPPARS